MTSNLDKARGKARGDTVRSHSYHRDFWPGMVGYLVVLAAVVIWGDLDGSNPWRYLLALLPVVPAVWMVRAVVRHVRRVDDYQRGLLLQGLVVGFAVAMIASLTVGFLGVAGLALPAAGWIIYGAGMMGWALASAFTSKS